mgnify:CR=1 FL=1
MMSPVRNRGRGRMGPFRPDDFEVGHYLPLKPYLERRKKNKE